MMPGFYALGAGVPVAALPGFDAGAQPYEDFVIAPIDSSSSAGLGAVGPDSFGFEFLPEIEGNQPSGAREMSLHEQVMTMRANRGRLPPKWNR